MAGIRRAGKTPELLATCCINPSVYHGTIQIKENDVDALETEAQEEK